MATEKGSRPDPITPKSAGAALGSKGQDVERLNKYLCRFGYIDSGIHAVFDMRPTGAEPPPVKMEEFCQRTEAALKTFQSHNGLAPTGVLDPATLAKMGRHRCGNPDIGEYVLSGRKWNKNALTYAFQEFTGDLSPDEIRAAISAAFGYWAAVTPLSFSEVAIQAGPDIIIRFVTGDHGDGSPFDGAGSVLAHAFYPEQGAISGDSHFDDAETWSVSLPATGIDLYTVAAHEFGHALGLDHSANDDALMAPFYGGPHRFLHQDDIDGIQALYGAQQWLNNKAVMRTYATFHSKNAWVFIDGAGWRKCRPSNPEGTTAMFAAACEARANGLTVTALATDSDIQELYV